MNGPSRALVTSVFAAMLLAASLGCGASSNDRPATTDVVTPPAAACTPVAAGTEVVSVKDAYGTLEGTLEIPEGCAGMPVVLVLSGSGSQDRDGNEPKIYALLAEGLKSAGIASLRFDDPGMGKSASALPRSNADIVYETEIDAMGSWIPFLAADQRFGPLVLAGHSQGSLTAILLAQKNKVAGVISLEGAGRPIGVVLREQLAPTLTAAERAEVDAAMTKLEHGELVDPPPAPLAQIMPLSVQPYFISWMKYDPKAEIAKVNAAALVVQGGTDAQVSEEDALRLEEGKPSASKLDIADMCHVLRQASVKDISAQEPQYTNPSLPLHPDLLPAISAFVGTLPRP